LPKGIRAPRPVAVMVSVSLCLLPGGVSAQRAPDTIGRLDSVIDVKQPRRSSAGYLQRMLRQVGLGRRDAGCERDPATPGRRGAIDLVRQGEVQSAWPNDSAVVRDGLRVDTATTLRFLVDGSRFGAGTIYFTPEIRFCPEQPPGRLILGPQPPVGSRGSYVFGSEPQAGGAGPPNRLILYVNNGAAVVNWGAGQLSVFALGREIRDSNTVFAVIVDSIAQRAAVHVLDGVVTMDAGRFRASRNESLTFSSSGDPVPSAHPRRFPRKSSTTPP
jgi:hypothetical protein